MVWKPLTSKGTGWKRSLLTAVLGAAALLGGIVLPSSVAQAHDRDGKCFERIRREEWKLNRAIERHGFYSRQAQHRWQKLRDLRGRCGFGRHGFWGNGRRWGDDDRFWDGRRHGWGDRDDRFWSGRRRHRGHDRDGNDDSDDRRDRRERKDR